ncbi:MAG: glycogen synthase GlgA [Planctomycetales bacterium]|nr:glycogen synthase GlgA [Planctomycetales bacterium]
MRIVIASSEAVPFSKTGGLADVAAALPKALDQSGHDVSLIIPHYPQFDSGRPNRPTTETTSFCLRVAVGNKIVNARVLRAKLSRCRVTVYLVDQSSYFDRQGVYGEDNLDYQDNCERFVFFSRAVLEIIQHFNLKPDVVHSNDWQTGLVPVLVAVEMRRRPGLDQTASVFTIHNMAFQGRFWHWDMHLTGLDWKYFNWRQMESFGYLNLLKSGIAFADMVTTVSPTYAREIQTPEYGCGLHGVLSSRSCDLRGILNGVDTEIWNPSTDPYIAKPYTIDTVELGKAACKAALQKQLGLPVRPDVPLFGSVSRMTGQKGYSLIAQSANVLLDQDAQFIFLGSGESHYEDLLTDLAASHPQQVSTTIGYNEKLSHQVEAGCDVFLMPSEFEPCGLNQMYSLIYGTVPLVRSVGGLADSVVNADDQSIARGVANGFSFSEFRSDVFLEQFCRARSMYADKPTWRKLQQNGMLRDWSWKKSAAEYIQVYEKAISKRQLAAECSRGKSPVELTNRDTNSDCHSTSFADGSLP